MNQWAFVTAAYAVTLLVSAGVALWSWRAMRKAEGDAEALAARRK